MVLSTNDDSRRVRPPALPIPPVDYDQAFFDRFNNILRLYFEQLNGNLEYLMSAKYPAENSDGSNNSTDALSGGATFTGTAELNLAPDVMVSCAADADGVLYFDFSVDGTNWETFPTNGFEVVSGIHEFHTAVKGPRYFRVRLVNGSSAQTSLRLYTYFGVFRQLNAPMNQAQDDFADAALVRPSSFDEEVVLGLRSDQEARTKFGRNDAVTAAEDIWEGGGDYSGLAATSNEEISVASSDADDTGTVLSSGTATGGSTTTLVDTGATFSSDGVAAGDCVLNDDRDAYGIITSVNSETQLTVREMHSGDANTLVSNQSGDTYRVVTAGSTGASVIRINQIMNESWVEQNAVFVVLNGLTTVTTSGVDAIRAYRATVIHAGTSGVNEGTITGNQETTTTNVFFQMQANFGQTAIAAFAVPVGTRCLVKNVELQQVRSAGSAASSVVALQVRTLGGAWRSFRVFSLSTNFSLVETVIGGELFHDHHEVRARALSVSHSSAITVTIGYKLINLYDR